MGKGVCKGYRVPKLEEFIEGFEFEIRNDYVIHINNKRHPYHTWTNGKVWWKKDPTKFYTDNLPNGGTLTQSGYFINWFKPFDEQSFIDQKLVRVKINNNE